MKYVVPIVWPVGFGSVPVVSLIACGDSWSTSFTSWRWWLFVIAWLVGTSLLVSIALPLKRVQVDREALYISNYLHEVRVPLPQVIAVSENYSWRPRFVTVEFRENTRFGRRVRFLPLFRTYRGQEHPVAAELRSLTGAS